MNEINAGKKLVESLFNKVSAIEREVGDDLLNSYEFGDGIDLLGHDGWRSMNATMQGKKIVMTNATVRDWKFSDLELDLVFAYVYDECGEFNSMGGMPEAIGAYKTTNNKMPRQYVVMGNPDGRTVRRCQEALMASCLKDVRILLRKF